MKETPTSPSGPTTPRGRGVVKTTPQRVDLDQVRRDAARDRFKQNHGTKPTR
uniref:Uncharacterized protein n=1 Tax=uncultured marine virus TaxID=186617 RepID=A0A0F7KZX3_9VIRU|nr:hypothetical protein [uncultured marine virus]